MPELPEVELTRRRLELDIVGKKIDSVVIRTEKLRLPIPQNLPLILQHKIIRYVRRRGKYLLFDCESGWLILHLGMTGFIRYLSNSSSHGKHDHLDVIFDDGSLFRFYDPRKFGIVAWTTEDPAVHPLLNGIGPEPLSNIFDGNYIYKVSRTRRIAVKLLIMNAAIVAGVGNIYANEALFIAAIRPDRIAASLTLSECERLALAICKVLSESIEQGSSQVVTEEMVAYHPLKLKVYGRGKEVCILCCEALEELRLGNRSTVFCPNCQA